MKGYAAFAGQCLAKQNNQAKPYLGAAGMKADHMSLTGHIGGHKGAGQAVGGIEFVIEALLIRAGAAPHNQDTVIVLLQDIYVGYFIGGDGHSF